MAYSFVDMTVFDLAAVHGVAQAFLLVAPLLPPHQEPMYGIQLVQLKEPTSHHPAIGSETRLKFMQLLGQNSATPKAVPTLNFLAMT